MEYILYKVLFMSHGLKVWCIKVENVEKFQVNVLLFYECHTSLGWIDFYKEEDGEI